MKSGPLSLVFIGLSITSSWGNGHATTYRALLRELAARGYRLTFLERRASWYEENADLPEPAFCNVIRYSSFDELVAKHAKLLETADATVLGSYVVDGAKIADFMAATCRHFTAFYDIDTPITLRALSEGRCEYLERRNVPQFDVYFSFSGGASLERLQSEFRARRPEALYCSVDPSLYYPISAPLRWDLGYLGTYSEDRQPTIERLLCDGARALPEQNFVLGGSQYPELSWPENVELQQHVPPGAHRFFYSAQRFTPTSRAQP